METLVKITSDVLEQIEIEKKIRGVTDVIVLFPLGSQFDQLIRLALEKVGIFCLVADPKSFTASDVAALQPKGIILSGGPASVYAETVPFDKTIFNLGIPVLGICLGFQLWAQHLGIRVVQSPAREFGVHPMTVTGASKLFLDCPLSTLVLQSHGDRVVPDPQLTVFGQTENSPVAAASYQYLYGVQFHPEVSETEAGLTMFKNFCCRICSVVPSRRGHELARQKINALADQVNGRRVLLALSGGSDSTVVAYLLKHARAQSGSPAYIRGVYIRGIDRPDDLEHVRLHFGNLDWMELKIVDATSEFLEVLKGQTTMLAKRLAMRGVYRAVLEQEADAWATDFIAQGTLYTDISESGAGLAGARKDQIKQHHNVGLHFTRPELTPLNDCVKDLARNIGHELGVPAILLYRHPFPGPGLIVRIEGEVDANRLATARQADDIYIQELRRSGLYDKVWQAGVVVTASQHTCSKGDEAIGGSLLVYWAVNSVNGFTAQAALLPPEFHARVAQRFTNEIREVGAVAYRISGKPPATIEWG